MRWRPVVACVRSLAAVSDLGLRSRGPTACVRSPGCGVGLGPPLAPADGLRPLARCRIEVLPALGPVRAAPPVARLGGGAWPALTSGCPLRTRLREGAGFRSGAVRPAVLAGTRFHCGAGLAVRPAVRPSAVGACSSGRRLIRRVPGRQSSRLRGLAVRSRREPTVRPRRCPSARRRRCGRPAVRPERFASLVRPVPGRRRAAVHLRSARPTVRAGRRRPTVRWRHRALGRRAALCRPSSRLRPLTEAAWLPAHPAARFSSLEGPIGVRRRPICRIPWPVWPIRRVAARVGCVCRIPAPRGLGGRIAMRPSRVPGRRGPIVRAPRRPWHHRPARLLGRRIAAGSRLAALGFFLRRTTARRATARDRVGAGQPEPGEDVVGAGRGRRAPGSIRDRPPRHLPPPHATEGG